MLPTPREHQAKDLELLRQPIRAGETRIQFEASVGYGKSVIIEIIAHGYANAGKRVLILSNRTAVVKQLKDRARGHDLIDTMTVQTADSRLTTLPQYKVILVDEAHMGGAGAQYGRVFDRSPGALIIGFTGTPTPELHKTLPCHVKGHDARWLTDQGFLAPLKYYCPDRVDLRKARVRNGDFVEEDILAEVEAKDICGDGIRSYNEGCVGRPTLIFCINQKHAWSVHEEFKSSGIETKVLLGGDKDVDEKIEWVKSGGPLIVVDKVSAGFDLPDLHAIIILRPTKSEQLWVQIMGRVARAAKGKTFGHVYDHVGNTRRCGTLTEERDFKKADGPSDDSITEDGDRLSIRTCEECFFIWEGGGCVCPECGEDNGKDPRISKKKAIELKEQEAAEIEEERRRAGLAARRAQGQAKTFKELVDEIASRPKTKSRHSARYSAKHVLNSRMEKAAKAGRLDEARSIQADLAANGFRLPLDLPDFETQELPL